MIVRVEKAAEKFIKKQPQNEKKKIWKVIQRIEAIDTYDNFMKSNIQYKKLVGRRTAENYQLYRIRVDKIRLIFYFKDDTIIIINNAGPRGGIYKNL